MNPTHFLTHTIWNKTYAISPLGTPSPQWNHLTFTERPYVGHISGSCTYVTPFAETGTFPPNPIRHLFSCSSFTKSPRLVLSLAIFSSFFCILLSDSASLCHRKNAFQLTLHKTCHDQVWTWRDMWDWKEPQKLAPKLKGNWVQSQRYSGVGGPEHLGMG